MSVIDEAVAALTPAPSEEDRAEARDIARSATQGDDWLSMALDQHVQLEEAFARAKSPDGGAQALKELGVLLTGHAIAEESVLYPAMAVSGEGGHADHAYKEQVMVKKEMAALEQLEPSSEAFQEKLEKIRVAVAHHMIEEEGTWFPGLRQADGVDQAMLTRRFGEEFDRYTGQAGERSAMGF